MPNLSAERAELFLPHLISAMGEFEINSPDRAAAFLAQIAHESAELSRLVENLMYSWQGLIKTWPVRFGHGKAATAKQRAEGEALARRLHRQPVAIANYVYANRYGNGPESSGDGWKYRGGGLIMTTFHDNYLATGTALGLDLVTTPELIREPPAACRAAAWFWRAHGLNELADTGDYETASKRLADFTSITRGIQGATLGLASRLGYWERAKPALGAAA